MRTIIPYVKTICIYHSFFLLPSLAANETNAKEPSADFSQIKKFLSQAVQEAQKIENNEKPIGMSCCINSIRLSTSDFPSIRSIVALTRSLALLFPCFFFTLRMWPPEFGCLFCSFRQLQKTQYGLGGHIAISTEFRTFSWIHTESFISYTEYLRLCR